jgi:hypothetical protein
MKFFFFIFLCIVTTTAIAQGDIADFLTGYSPITLQAFMDFAGVPGEDQQEFENYYRFVIEDIRTTRSVVKKTVRKQKLEQQGINSLEIKQPQWGRAVTAMLQKEHPSYRHAHRFAIRYGALESFYEQKARRKNSTWAKMQGFFYNTKETVAGWFSALRPKGRAV